MKEMILKDWDGKVFNAYADDVEITSPDKGRQYRITGFDCGRWLSSTGIHWTHAYPVDWNKPKPKRMTSRQLAKWLAKGNGEYCDIHGVTVWLAFNYLKENNDKEVGKDCRVRTWDSDKWIEPTVDLIKEED